MVLGDKEEIKPRELEVILKLKNLAVLPEDLQVRRASNQQIPVVALSPNAPFSKSLRRFASQMIGQTIQEPKPKTGFFEGIRNFFKKLFGGKNNQQPTPSQNQ
jgi:MinD-like ATPase involved in chromosome partitioning or flagellar assembly